MSEDRYVPAAGLKALTRLYDPIVALTMREQRWRPALVRAVLDGGPAVVADVGAGTGTLSLQLAPHTHVIAIDGDPEALAIARAKPGADRVDWRQGTADALPLDDASVDRVVVSLVLHHLSDPAKNAALAEMRRVLKPGGRLHVADWGRPRGLVPTVGFRVLQVIDGVENTRALGEGRLPDLLRAAGFTDIDTAARLGTAFGTLELHVAR
jgi:ubiquinone/menaquinone biosynthesis C-methylase UbiE